MIDAEQYLLEIERLANLVERDQIRLEAVAFEPLAHSAVTSNCVAFRRAVMTTDDIVACRAWLECGYVPDLPFPEQQAWAALIGDVSLRVQHLSLERVCVRYSPEQPLFLGAPALWRHIRRRGEGGTLDHELIDDRAVSCVYNEVYQVPGGHSTTPLQLPAAIPAWARKSFPKAPRYLRLNPLHFSVGEPSGLMRKAATVPADPKWMSRLALFPRARSYARYELLDAPLKDNPEQYREYHLGGLRRLEVHAIRREADYLSMMIEELPAADAPHGLMVGYGLHLDTRAVCGTPIGEARLQHLDLALNVYTGRDRDLRAADSLQEGRAWDATYRTHLYRIEDIPFAALFSIAPMFFRSQVLIAEWFQDLGFERSPDLIRAGA